jgi:hypothetical protein
VLEVPHEGSGVEEVDGGDAEPVEWCHQRTSLLDVRWWRVMQRAVVSFYQDEEGHWAARLECGHGQHVRHDPPWMVREWVMTEEGRAARIGSLMECRKCDEGPE